MPIYRSPIMNGFPLAVERNTDAEPPPVNNFELMLKESIAHFLAEHQKGYSNFSHFASIFSRLIQAMTDPPLEITWFYSAVTFHSYPSKKSVLAAKDLFQLLISCSTPCNNGLKRVAMLAPVLHLLYYVVLEWLNMVSCLKREIEELVEGIVGFISIYCSQSAYKWENISDKLMVGFVDLLRVWTIERGEVGDCLRVFFPLVNGEVCDLVKFGGVRDLAGVVMVEVFFLRLCLKLCSNAPKEELQKDMKSWAVQTIKGFQNSCFLDLLLIMLLEPSLPVNALVNRDGEHLLREVLYDTLLLGEYSILGSEMWDQLLGQHFAKFAIRWLLVADNAVQFARESCDQMKATAYVNAFTESCLRTRIIKWVTDQASHREEINRLSVSTPKSLIGWLLTLEDQGFEIFGQCYSKLHSRAGIGKLKIGNENGLFHPECEFPNYPIGGSFICFEDNLREQSEVNYDHEMADLFDDTPNQTEAERRRKRKEGNAKEVEAPLKLAKFSKHIQDSPGEVEIRSMV